jgi:hypothetical protein
MLGNMNFVFEGNGGRGGCRRDGLAGDLGFPLESEMELPLLAALELRDGAIWFSRDGEWLERILAEYFGLSRYAREYSDPSLFRSKGARAWRNSIQWVRNHLVEQGLIDKRVRNRWALTERGWEVARSFQGTLNG